MKRIAVKEIKGDEVLKREPFYDFLKSIFMIFVFFHHFYLTLNLGSYENDYFKYFNPFAELFVGLAGFMIGYVFLYRNKDPHYFQRGLKILGSYYLVAVPIAFVVAIVQGEYLLGYLLNVFLLNQNITYVGILKFYGVLFLLLPFILILYKKSIRLTLLLSLVVFTVSTWGFNQFDFQMPFLTYTFITVLQWQLFFVVGIWIGDLHKRKKINYPSVFKWSLLTSALALFVQIKFVGGMPDEKVPYHFSKILNTVYLVPVYLYFFRWVYGRLKDTFMDRTIRTIGRNSLKAFVLSEFIRFFVLEFPVQILNIELNVLEDNVISIGFAVLLVFVIAALDRIKLQPLSSKIIFHNEGRG